jgi:hypothetical protein
MKHENCSLQSLHLHFLHFVPVLELPDHFTSRIPRSWGLLRRVSRSV